MQPRPSSLAEARDWVNRAELDVRAVCAVLDTSPPLPAIAVYHAQQAAEEALTAFLAAHNTVFRPTHNLQELLTQCLPLNPTFSRFLLTAQTLTPYAVRYRYPGGPLEPSVTEAEEAERLAREVVEYVRQVLGI